MELAKAFLSRCRNLEHNQNEQAGESPSASEGALRQDFLLFKIKNLSTKEPQIHARSSNSRS
jgi:hypothetical protein